MSSKSAPIVDRIRIIPRPEDFLDRNIGSSGEVFYDKANDTLRLYNGKIAGGIEIAKTDLTNVSDTTITTRLTELGYAIDTGETGNANITVSDTPPVDAVEGELWLDTISGVLFVYYNEWIQPSYNYVVDETTGNSFNQIEISGQGTVEAIGQETLTLAAGANITLTTDPETNTITIASTASGGDTANGFGIIAISGGSTITSDSANDTLNVAGGSGISLTNVGGTLTISTTASGTNFSTLGDIQTAGLNVSKIYEPAAVMLKVDNVGTSAYTFTPHYAGNNPNIYAISGTTIAFDLTLASGHPFEIQDNTLSPLTSNIVHVSTSGVVSTGLNAQGKDSGVLYWRIPAAGSGTYVYQCQSHAAMFGTILVKNIALI